MNIVFKMKQKPFFIRLLLKQIQETQWHNLDAETIKAI